MRGSINNQGLTVLLKHLFLQNGEGGRLPGAIVSRSRVAAEDADSGVDRQPRIDVAHGRQKVSVNWIVPDSARRLASALPDLLQLGSRYFLASNVTVKSRLLRSAAELHDDGPHFLREIGMANHSDSQIGIQFPLVRLA